MRLILLSGIYLFLLCEAAGAQPVTIPSQASANHDGLCRAQWTKRGDLDTKMFDYCLGRQREGYESLATFTAKNAAYPWMQGVVDAAVMKWTKRDTRDDTMVAYEVDHQLDAFLDHEYAAKQPGWNGRAFERCRDEWMARDPNWQMAMYCYKHKTGS